MQSLSTGKAYTSMHTFRESGNLSFKMPATWRPKWLHETNFKVWPEAASIISLFSKNGI